MNAAQNSKVCEIFVCGGDNRQTGGEDDGTTATAIGAALELLAIADLEAVP